MKIISIALAAFICLSILASAVPDNVTTGHYNISFDLGVTNDSYSVNVVDPIRKEALNGEVTTKYNVSIQDKTNLDRKIRIKLTEYEEDQIIPTAEELKDSYVSVLSIAGNVKRSEVDTREIDGVRGVIISVTPKADKSRGITEKESFVAEWNPSDRLNILLDLDFPWEEGTLSFLKTIHIEDLEMNFSDYRAMEQPTQKDGIYVGDAEGDDFNHSTTGQEKYVLLDSEAGNILHELGYSEADLGKEYLLIKIKVENHGYNAFKVDPYCFKVTVNKIVYDREYLGSMAENGYPPLEEVTLEDGGEISGYIAFSVPDETTKYTLKYRPWSWDDYNIRWKE